MPRYLLTQIVLTLAVGISTAHAQKLYWTEQATSEIQRANVDGTGVEGLVSGLMFPQFIAVDVDGGKMYWTDPVAQEIRRADLDGGNEEILLTAVQAGVPNGIAVDPAGGTMYWTDFVGRIVRADLDGGNAAVLVTGGFGAPGGIALDLDGGKMYWVDEGTATGIPPVIRRADLDGSNAEDLVTAGFVNQIVSPADIALDVAAGKMYWTDRGSEVVKRAGMEIPNDGSTPNFRTDLETLVSGLAGPSGIALDLPSGTIYWSEAGGAAIRRAPLDGGVADTAIGGLGSPFGLAFAPCRVDADCDDGLFCTGVETCDAGTGMCQSGTDPCGGQLCDEQDGCMGCSDDADCNDSDPCTTDICTAGICDNPFNTDPCDDNVPCTENDVCDGAGACAGTPVDCTAFSDVCNDGVCNAGTGDCEAQPTNEGGMCDDNDPCTINDTCSGGACAGTPVDCTVFDDDCNVGVCNPGTGDCEAQPTNEGGMCTDNGLFCDGVETCVDGACQSSGNPCVPPQQCDEQTGTCVDCLSDADCEDTNPCTTDLCTAGTCDNLFNTDPCDDNNLCTANDVCDGAGACAGTPVDCTAFSDDCNDGVCNPATGDCEAQPTNEGGMCDDNDPCTTGNTCAAGVCGAAVDCSGLNDDCIVGVCNQSDGTCQPAAANEGGACDDGVLCTEDTCTSGVCIGIPIAGCCTADADCDDDNDCTTDTCGVDNLCVHTAIDMGECDDGNACTENDACDNGVCVGAAAAAGTVCDDGDACTENDTCDDSGGCAGASVNCDDGNSCTVDSCDAAAGCVNTPDDTLPCDDGNVCTTADLCDATGACVGTPVAEGGDCDDNDPCTENDVCDDVGVCAGTAMTCADNGIFCDGQEICVNGACQSSGNPCPVLCGEATGTCFGCSTDADCDDGVFCNGSESCVGDNCVPGSPADCNDGISCTEDACDMASDACVHTPVDSACDDGGFCNGEETCDPVNGCQDGADPCPNQSCDEDNDVCEGPVVPPGPEGNAGTVDPLGTLVVDVMTPDGDNSAVVDILRGSTGAEVFVVLVDNSGAPGVDGVNTFDGFGDALALGITLQVTTTLVTGFTAVLELTVPESDLADLGVSPQDAAMHVLDDTVDPPTWELAGTNSVGRSDPTEVPGDYGYQMAGDSVTFWVVRTELSVFAVGRTAVAAPVDGGGEQPAPGQDVPPPDEQTPPVDETPPADGGSGTPGTSDGGGGDVTPPTGEPMGQPTPDAGAPPCGATPCGALGLAALPMIMLGLVSRRRRTRARR